MKLVVRILILVSLLSLLITAMPAHAAPICKTTMDGDFHDASIWDCGSVPEHVVDVRIKHNVTNSGTVHVFALYGINGTFTNSGTVDAYHIDYAKTQASLTNSGKITAVDQFLNSGTIFNSGKIRVHNTFINRLDGTFTNSGTIVAGTLKNFGMFTNKCGGIIDYWTFKGDAPIDEPCPVNTTTAGKTSNLPVVVPPPDHRLNWKKGDSYAILYPAFDDAGDTAIHGYCVFDDEGVLGLLATAADVADPLPAENTLITNSGVCNLSFYVLDTGEYQINIGPDAEGKVWVFIWDAGFEGEPSFYEFNVNDIAFGE